MPQFRVEGTNAHGEQVTLVLEGANSADAASLASRAGLDFVVVQEQDESATARSALHGSTEFKSHVEVAARTISGSRTPQDSRDPKPHLLIPTSPVAVGLFLVFVGLLALAAAGRNRLWERYASFEMGGFLIDFATGLFGWTLVVAVIRYIAFVYPWERRNRGRGT